MKTTWLNFHDVIPNTLREIEFALKKNNKNHFFRL